MTDPLIDALPTDTLEALHVPIPQPIDDSEIERYSTSATVDDSMAYIRIETGDASVSFPGTISVRADSGNPKDLIGNTKADLSLVPPAASLYTAAGFADGAAKYGPYNWRENKVKARVYIAAAMRHLSQYLDGENTDPISDVPHLGHAMACLAILADATETGNLIDDRPKPGAAGDMIRRYTPEKKFG